LVGELGTAASNRLGSPLPMFGELNPLAREVFVPFFTVLVPSICWVSKKCYGFSKLAPARAITRCKENIHCHGDLPPTSTDVLETSGDSAVAL
jgi:hypothetical protein